MAKNDKQLFFEYVGEFLMVFLPRQIGRSDNTIRSYKHGLNMFRNYMAKEIGVGLARLSFPMITRDSVLIYLQWLMEVQGCSAATRNQRLAGLFRQQNGCSVKARECFSVRVPGDRTGPI